jgi:hypothetical protein
MGRGVRINKFIVNECIRRITFKKSRIDLIKKAMQLSLISGCQISLKVYWKEDDSLVEINSFKTA